MIDPSKENVIYNLCQWKLYHYIAMLTAKKKYVTLFHSTIQCITSNSFYFIILLTFDLETGSQKQVGFIV